MKDGLFKVRSVDTDNISSVHLTSRAELGGLKMSSASLLALPVFLISAFGAPDFLETIFPETFELFSLTRQLGKWLVVTNEPEAPIEDTQRTWTQPVFQRNAQNLKPKKDENERKLLTFITVNSGRTG